MGVKRTFLKIQQNDFPFLLKVDFCAFSKPTFFKNSLIEFLSVVKLLALICLSTFNEKIHCVEIVFTLSVLSAHSATTRPPSQPRNWPQWQQLLSDSSILIRGQHAPGESRQVQEV